MGQQCEKIHLRNYHLVHQQLLLISDAEYDTDYLSLLYVGHPLAH